MSDQSDDDIPESFNIGPRRPNPAATRSISALSDDESDDGAPPARSSAPPLESPMRDSPQSPVRSPESPAQSPRTEPAPTRSRDTSSRPLDCYQRTVTTSISEPAEVDVMYFPPSVPFPSALTTAIEGDVPLEQCPILYRLRQDAVVEDEKAADTLIRRLRECDYDPLRYSEFLESNARLVTWSDGSRSLSIGMHTFLLLDDNLGSQHFVFRRGEKVQTFESSVSSVARVQASSTTDGRAKLVMAKAVERAASKRTASRTMLRAMEDDSEKQERQARIESQRRERERLRQEARKRQMKERQNRSVRQLSVEFVESNDEDSGDEGARRIAERHDASRLMRAKHSFPSHPGGSGDISVKRRKLSGRRVLQNDEETEDDD